jgi:hypothetical protein
VEAASKLKGERTHLLTEQLQLCQGDALWLLRQFTRLEPRVHVLELANAAAVAAAAATGLTLLDACEEDLLHLFLLVMMMLTLAVAAAAAAAAAGSPR